MADFVDSTVKEIESRMTMLREEMDRLEAARTALVGTGRRGPGRPRGSGTTSSDRTTTRRPGRPRGRRSGTRATQALELVRSQPGITIPQLAQSLNIEPNYLYRVMPRLVSDGLIRRDGQGWHPVSE